MKKYVMILISLSLISSLVLRNPVLVAEEDLSEEITNMEDLEIDLGDIESDVDLDLTDKTVSIEDDGINSASKEEALVEMESDDDYLVIKVVDETLEYKDTEEGVVIFESENDYSVESNLIEGGIQLLFNIESQDSKHEFIMDLELSAGSKLMYENEEYFIEGEDGEIEFILGHPWATDSEGNFIETNYKIRGGRLIQTVEYSGSNYPLKADPLFCNDTINNTDTKWDKSYDGGKGTLKVVPQTCARVYLSANWVSATTSVSSALLSSFSTSAIAKDMWSEIKADSSYKTYISSSRSGRIKDQFVCHAVNPTTLWKSSWNLEPWRRDYSLYNTYKAKCNPPG